MGGVHACRDREVVVATVHAFGWRSRVSVVDRLVALTKRQKWEIALYELTIYVCTVVTAVWIVWSVK
jgi:hypothetical protein